MVWAGWRLVAVGLSVVGGLAWLGGRAWSSDRLPVAQPIVVTRAFIEVADTVRRNETLSELFARQRIVGGTFLDVLSQMDGINPRRVRPNTVFEFRYVIGDSVPDRVRVRVSRDAFLRLDRDSSGAWSAETEIVTWTVYTERVSGTIETSLYDDMRAAIPDSILPPAARDYIVWDLADGIFAWQIDFTRDFYPGDAFVVLYERLTSSLGEVRYGRVIAASIETRGSENTAYVLDDSDGRNAYYDAGGRSLRRAFKMYPVKFRRISSNFSRSRLNPVLKTRRAHLGTDYAADAGTPIEATGDGTITRAGRWGGYGIMVSIRHPKQIETRYAHMSRLARGIRPGVRVRQGDLIGYVGMTGVATGPNVHYEFIKNGRPLNARRVDLGDGDPVPSVRRAAFDSARTYLDRLMGRPVARDTVSRVD